MELAPGIFLGVTFFIGPTPCTSAPRPLFLALDFLLLQPMSKPYPKIYLKPGRQSSLERFHLWVFSGAIQKIEGVPAQGVPKDGDVVEVYSTVGQYLATGHYQKGSITVRICTFTQ